MRVYKNGLEKAGTRTQTEDSWLPVRLFLNCLTQYCSLYKWISKSMLVLLFISLSISLEIISQSHYRAKIQIWQKITGSLFSLIPLGGKNQTVALKIRLKIMESGHITSWQTDGEWVETVTDFIFLGSKITADGDCSLEIKRHLLLGGKAMTNPRQHIKKKRHYFANKGLSSQGYGFSSSHVWMWELDCEESWAPKNWCF